MKSNYRTARRRPETRTYPELPRLTAEQEQELARRRVAGGLAAREAY